MYSISHAHWFVANRALILASQCGGSERKQVISQPIGGAQGIPPVAFALSISFLFLFLLMPSSLNIFSKENLYNTCADLLYAHLSISLPSRSLLKWNHKGLMELRAMSSKALISAEHSLRTKKSYMESRMMSQSPMCSLGWANCQF